jgi:hypothetical protein
MDALPQLGIKVGDLINHRSEIRRTKERHDHWGKNRVNSQVVTKLLEFDIFPAF